MGALRLINFLLKVFDLFCNSHDRLHELFFDLVAMG